MPSEFPGSTRPTGLRGVRQLLHTKPVQLLLCLLAQLRVIAQLQDLPEVSDRLPAVASFAADKPSAVVGIGKVGLQLNSLVEVGNGEVIVPFRAVGSSPVVIGVGIVGLE
jgi:hypothetical protein